MLPVQFCNYNLDYQQRLGFLKLLVWLGQSVRGGKEELVRKIESFYGQSATQSKRAKRVGPSGREAQAPRQPHLRGTFDPDVLLQRDEIPSWQPGFSFQRLDRLVLWAEMLGLVTANGRLAEWATPLLADRSTPTIHAKELPNPFLLSRRDCAYFLALLTYHDQVFLHLIPALARFESGTRIEVRGACVETTNALCKTLDCVSGSNIQAVRTRQSLRDLLERLAGMEHLTNKHAFFNPSERPRAIQDMVAKSSRNHLAEYHAISRFEQLTDLGLLVKDNQLNSNTEWGDRYRARTSWSWYTTEALRSSDAYLQAAGCDVEEFLQNQWARSCALRRGDLRELDARRDQLEIARLLDRALPRARRQLGAIQVHTWVFIAALDAIEEGMALEFSVAYSMLDAMRQDQRYSTYLRQSGQQSYLGRTASLINGTMEEYVHRYPLSI